MSDVYNSIHLYLISRWKKVVYIWIYSVVWLNVWPSCFLFIRPSGLGRMDKYVKNLSQVEQFSRLFRHEPGLYLNVKQKSHDHGKKSETPRYERGRRGLNMCAHFFSSLFPCLISLYRSLSLSQTHSRFSFFGTLPSEAKFSRKKSPFHFNFCRKWSFTPINFVDLKSYSALLHNKGHIFW